MDENIKLEVEDESWRDEIRRAEIEQDQRLIQERNFNPYAYAAQLLIKIGLITLLCIGLLMAWVYTDNALLPFDSAKWKANTYRKKQVGRLVRQYQLVGMTKPQITQLLGKPKDSDDDIWTWECNHNYGDWAWTFLDVRFKNGRVVKYEVRTIRD